MANPNRFRAGKNVSVSKEGRSNRSGTGQVHSRQMGIDLNPPTGLSAIAGETTVTVSFTAPAGDTPTNLLYALSTNGGSTYGAYTAFSPADFTSPVTISGLTANQAYVVKFKSFMDGEESGESETLSFATVAAAPTGLSASNITSSTADISFTQGTGGGSNSITNYKYALSTNNGSTYGSYTALSPADSTSPITITGLSSGITYAIKIRAVTSAGDGTESAAVTNIEVNPYGAATGGSSSSITVSGVNYTLLTFNSSSTLTVTRSGVFDVLWCGGGGGGGGCNEGSDAGGGGGGGGQVRQSSLLNLTSNQSITIGGGGGGGALSSNGGSGGTTTFGSQTSSTGGGGGGGNDGGGSPNGGGQSSNGGDGTDISAFIGQSAGHTYRGAGGGGGGAPINGQGGMGGGNGTSGRNGGNGAGGSNGAGAGGGGQSGGGGGGVRWSAGGGGVRSEGAGGGSGVVYVRFRP